ncbi:MAG: hypothetical protein M3N19_09485 [Candidatus Eremiobacteraeota bacterium]|nr:hypothetical protein [Candidatus Eremiobacteraeota bacterium]
MKTATSDRVTAIVDETIRRVKHNLQVGNSFDEGQNPQQTCHALGIQPDNHGTRATGFIEAFTSK